jgi:hypothetical protein
MQCVPDHRCDLDVEAAQLRGICGVRLYERGAALGVTAPAERRVLGARGRAGADRERR